MDQLVNGLMGRNDSAACHCEEHLFSDEAISEHTDGDCFAPIGRSQ